MRQVSYLRYGPKLNLPSEVHGGSDESRGEDCSVAIAVGPEGQAS